MVRKKKKKKCIVVRGKRKEAIARAVVKEGKGQILINNMSIDSFNPYLRDLIIEVVDIAGDVVNKLDITVNVSGGGTMGQMDAARNAIARGIVAFTGDEKLKEKYLDRNRFFLVEDYRRTEPKKYLGPKARARYQKSYR